MFIENSTFDTSASDKLSDKCSELIRAVQLGLTDEVERIFKEGYIIDRNVSSDCTLLHWTAVNNYLDVAACLIKNGCDVNTTGGTLNSTALHWAARHGHLSMIKFLMANGGDPDIRDDNGFSCLHMASARGHTPIVAYLIAMNQNPDATDNNGQNALMISCSNCSSRDCIQFLIAFSSDINSKCSREGNTALHYAVLNGNTVAVRILIEKGATLDISNNNGYTPLQLALMQKNKEISDMIINVTGYKKYHLFMYSRRTRKFGMQLFPLVLLTYIGLVFTWNVPIILKMALLALVYGIYKLFSYLFFDCYRYHVVPVSFSASIWIIFGASYFLCVISSFRASVKLHAMCIIFHFCTLFMFIKLYKTDPGVLKPQDVDIRNTILKLLEKNELNLLCCCCIILRPLRSKHCMVCKKCISKFDHHCPWFDQCIGENNYNIFLLFLFECVVFVGLHVRCVYLYAKMECLTDSNYPFFSEISTLIGCAPWSCWLFFIGAFSLFWLIGLIAQHLYQVSIGMTTNERLNRWRYKYHNRSAGTVANPYNFGVLQNFVDVLGVPILNLKPSRLKWSEEYSIPDLIDRGILQRGDGRQII